MDAKWEILRVVEWDTQGDEMAQEKIAILVDSCSDVPAEQRGIHVCAGGVDIMKE